MAKKPSKELTFEQVRDGIILALKGAYPDAQVRSDYTPQNVEDGDFNVVFVTARTPAHLWSEWLHSVTFDVVYYCDANSITDDMLRVCIDLPLLLETITTPSGAKLHPQGSIEPSPQDDGTVHTIVRYDYHVNAKRIHVDEYGKEIPYKPGGELDDSDLMRVLQLHVEDFYVETKEEENPAGD